MLKIIFFKFFWNWNRFLLGFWLFEENTNKMNSNKMKMCAHFILKFKLKFSYCMRSFQLYCDSGYCSPERYFIGSILYVHIKVINSFSVNGFIYSKCFSFPCYMLLCVCVCVYIFLLIWFAFIYKSSFSVRVKYSLECKWRTYSPSNVRWKFLLSF